MVIRLAAAMILALIAYAGPAHAQLRQPRCGGWPPLRFTDGMVIGEPGETCYGQVFERGLSSNTLRLVALAVKTGPAQSSFRFIGDREFEFTPKRTLRGMDRVVLVATIEEDGKQRTRDYLIRATTSDEFEKAGGDRLRPPDGSNVNRAGGPSKTRR